MDAPAVGSGVRGSILVIDDDDSILELLSVWFSKAGYLVRTARNGREGIRSINGTHFDLVITDIFMPEMDGMEVIQKIAPMDKVKIIAMSAGERFMGKQFVLEMAVEFGAFWGLKKPLNKDHFLNVVQSALVKETNYEKQ